MCSSDLGLELKSLYGYKAASPLHLLAIDDIKEMNLDIIHAHTEFGVGIFARIVGRRLEIPVVSTYHTTYEDYTHYINFLHLGSVDNIAKKAVSYLSRLYGDSCITVISPSKKTKELLESYKVKSKIRVIPTGLDLQRFDPKNTSDDKKASIRKECGIANGQASMVYVGRLAQEKSIDFVIDGFSYVKRMNINCKLVIVGGGPDQDALKQKVTKLGLEEYVYFAGKKDPSEIPAYYHAFDMFVSASLTETQGMTFIEALAAGLPVFARPDEVLDDLVIEGVDGYLFKTPEMLALKIQTYMNLTTDEKTLMHQEGFKYCKPYDAEVFYQEVIDVYKKSIAIYDDSYILDEINRRGENVKLVWKHHREDDEEILISSDLFYSHGLRKGMKATSETINLLKDDEKYVKAYQACIRKLAAKDRTMKEMYDYLTQNTELDISHINKLIESLEKRNLIDDDKYALNYVEKSISGLQGKMKIERNLKKKGVAIDIIDRALNDQDALYEFKHALKYANKIKNQLKDKSLKEKKFLIKKKMYAQGYTMDIIDEALEQINLLDDQAIELDALQKCAESFYRKYKSKSKGSELRNKVFKGCITKGFNYEDIYLILNEMEWDNE